MNKQTMVLALLVAGTSSAQALEVSNIKLDGFVDIVWTLSDGTDLGRNGDESQFDTFAELDFSANLSDSISTRFDADLNPGGVGAGDSGRLEQAFLSWKINPQIGLKAGVFNNDLTFEAEDSPDMYQITHGQLYDIWNGQTDLDGNNITGVELSYVADQFTGTIGFLNDLNSVAEENSIKVSALVRATSTMEIKAGLITQDASAENILDISLKMNPSQDLIIGAEILSADEIFDLGLMIMANFKINDDVAITGRFDQVSYDAAGADDTTSFTIAALYKVDSNMSINGELRINNDDNTPVFSPIGEGDGTTARLEFLAKF